MSGDGQGDYEGVRRVTFGEADGDTGGGSWIPVCPKCGRFVKADEVGCPGDPEKPNAVCKVHGHIAMPFEGYL